MKDLCRHGSLMARFCGGAGLILLSLASCVASRPHAAMLCGTVWPPKEIALQSHRYAGVTYVDLESMKAHGHLSYEM